MEITGNGPRGMLELAARLAQADKVLRSDLRRRFRNAAEPAAAMARQSILSAPSRHDGTLRAEIAATVGVSTAIQAAGNVSVAVVSDGHKMPPGKENMNARADDLKFRHPLFGDREHWYDESIAPAWFEGPLIASRDQFTAAAVRAIQDTARMVGG